MGLFGKRRQFPHGSWEGALQTPRRSPRCGAGSQSPQGGSSLPSGPLRQTVSRAAIGCPGRAADTVVAGKRH